MMGADSARELERSRARLDEAQRIAHLGWWEWDAGSNVVTWSDELHRIYGIEPGTFGGTFEAFLARVYPDDVEPTRTLVLDTIRAGGEFTMDHRIVRPDGEVRMLHTRARTQRDDRGVSTRMMGTCWDITVRWRLLERVTLLADAGRLLASLDVEPALAGVAQLIVPRLAAACAVDLLAGGARRVATVVTDLSAASRLEAPDGVLSGCPAIWTDDRGSHMGVPMVARGEVLGVILFLGGEGRVYASSDLELAEELGRRAALALENARLYRESRDALRVREEFLSIAAHEIRTPVTSIHLAVQGLRDGDQPTELTRKLLDIVEREDRRLAQLVDDLLDLGRIRSGHLQIDLTRVDLVQVAREVVDRLAPQSARTGSEVSIASDARVVGSWDRARLDQVVSNLLSNAIRFGQGKPIRVEVRAQDGRAVLRVSDQGMGIPPEDQRRIFEPFERAVRERTFGGLGLGLYIVRTIVEALGGTVHLQSAVGAGATFTVELPREVRA